MDTTIRDDLQQLLEYQATPCLSFFLPMERAGKETRQNPIRLKNAVREAENRLEALGVSYEERATLLRPIEKLLDDSVFWEEQSDGLAMFRSAERMDTYRLPIQFDDLLVVANRFHLKPLFSLFVGNGAFYILALSQKKVRLLQGTRYNIEERELPSDMPTSLEEALAYDDPEKQLQFRTGATVGAGQQAAQFHGHGLPRDQHKSDILRFFIEIDRGMQQLLRDEKAPLVLAGVDYLLPLYRERNSYPHLLETGVTGSPDTLKAEELHKRAWDIVEPFMREEQKTAEERYWELSGTEQISNDLRQIVPAAVFGRVGTLFVANGHQVWGTFDPATGTLLIHQTQEEQDEDLLDLAAVHTFLKSGTVYTIPPENIPGERPVAAIFRY